MGNVKLGGTGRPTVYCKRLIAESMYRKGKSFINAAFLLRHEGGYEFVVLHLLCQGLEIVLKATLILYDYDTYRPQLRPLGHNLGALVKQVQKAFGLRDQPPRLAMALAQLNTLYSTHRLRYATAYDVLVDPRAIASPLFSRRMKGVIRLCERAFRQPKDERRSL